MACAVEMCEFERSHRLAGLLFLHRLLTSQMVLQLGSNYIIDVTAFVTNAGKSGVPALKTILHDSITLLLYRKCHILTPNGIRLTRWYLILIMHYIISLCQLLSMLCGMCIFWSTLYTATQWRILWLCCMLYEITGMIFMTPTPPLKRGNQWYRVVLFHADRILYLTPWTSITRHKSSQRNNSLCSL